MKLKDVDLRKEKPRHNWAQHLFCVLEESKPLLVPEKPYSLRGVDGKELARLIKHGKGDEDRRVLQQYLYWERSVNKAKGRNRLTLWSLLRMVQVFDETDETHGQADTVRDFLSRFWGMEGAGLERTLEQNLHSVAGAMV